jgi:hypothetical protein
MIWTSNSVGSRGAKLLETEDAAAENGERAPLVSNLPGDGFSPARRSRDLEDSWKTSNWWSMNEFGLVVH